VKKLAKLVKNLLHGERNGKETGRMFSTVVKNVEKIN
tara:strand:- start:1099 stop:1209 length:111 start_codon:yes stop_codon:yes gene_type:complete